MELFEGQSLTFQWSFVWFSTLSKYIDPEKISFRSHTSKGNKNKELDVCIHVCNKSCTSNSIDWIDLPHRDSTIPISLLTKRRLKQVAIGEYPAVIYE